MSNDLTGRGTVGNWGERDSDETLVLANKHTHTVTYMYTIFQPGTLSCGLERSSSCDSGEVCRVETHRWLAAHALYVGTYVHEAAKPAAVELVSVSQGLTLVPGLEVPPAPCLLDSFLLG